MQLSKVHRPTVWILKIAIVIGLVIGPGIFIALAPHTPSTPIPEAQVRIAILRGIEYLKSQYSDRVGLLSEAPDVAPHKFWLFNDNALAAYTLTMLNETDTAALLLAALERYGYQNNGLEEVLWGMPVEWPPRVSNSLLVEKIDGLEVWVELSNGEQHFQDWMNYTNLAMLGALNAYHHGDPRTARNIFWHAIAKFDGTGFKDAAFRDEYETYKLAITLYTLVITKMPLGQLAHDLAMALLSKQASSGGFHTHYSGQDALRGDTNIETTSLTLLALTAYLNYSP